MSFRGGCLILTVASSLRRSRGEAIPTDLASRWTLGHDLESDESLVEASIRPAQGFDFIGGSIFDRLGILFGCFPDHCDRRLRSKEADCLFTSELATLCDGSDSFLSYLEARFLHQVEYCACIREWLWRACLEPVREFLDDFHQTGDVSGACGFGMEPTPWAEDPEHGLEHPWIAVHGNPMQHGAAEHLVDRTFIEQTVERLGGGLDEFKAGPSVSPGGFQHGTVLFYSDHPAAGDQLCEPGRELTAPTTQVYDRIAWVRWESTDEPVIEHAMVLGIVSVLIGLPISFHQRLHLPVGPCRGLVLHLHAG